MRRRGGSCGSTARRLESNLLHALRELAPRGRAEAVAEMIAALIDGLWIRHSLSDAGSDPAAAAALVEETITRRWFGRSMAEADYVIVGAGSAGCALAYRLSEDGRNSVLVLEYGGTDFGPLIQMPAAFSIPMNMRALRLGLSERTGTASRRPPARHAARQGDRRLVLHQRHGLRARPRDGFRPLGSGRRARLGASGTCFPISSGWRPRMAAREGLAGHRRAASCDPRDARRTRSTRPSPMPAWRPDTPSRPDYNGAQQEGFGPMEMTVWNGPALVGRQRLSPAGAGAPECAPPHRRARRAHRLRRPACHRRRDPPPRPERDRGGEAGGDRLRLVDQLAEAPDAFRHRSGGASAGARRRCHRQPARRRRQSAGSSGSLRPAWNAASRSRSTPHLGLRGRARIGIEWLLTRAGLGATNHFEACAFIRSRAGVPYPDIQMHFLPAAVRYDGGARGEGARLPGPCRADALAVTRRSAPEGPGSARGTVDPLQLHEHARGLARISASPSA